VLVTVAGISTGALSIDAASNVFITSQTTATSAITALDVALHSVNTLRANLGAITNRLEHAITNQQNQEQNMQAAESVIRDTDFAEETTKFTRKPDPAAIVDRDACAGQFHSAKRFESA